MHFTLCENELIDFLLFMPTKPPDLNRRILFKLLKFYERQVFLKLRPRVLKLINIPPRLKTIKALIQTHKFFTLFEP